jgi:membrane protein DedA with SNARE-associated domain
LTADVPALPLAYQKTSLFTRESQPMLHDFFTAIITWYMGNITYPTIIALMAIESSFLPLPSEVVIPPAAWKAAEGSLSLVGVVLCGMVGSIIGALFNYTLSLFLGRTIIHRIADTKIMHALFITREKIEKAEAYFLKYGKTSTFIGRLVPVIRHLISIPAGISRMRLDQFILFTALGSLLWSTILAALGYFLYTKKELLELAYQRISYVLLALGVLFVGYLVVKARLKVKKQPAA